MIEPAAVEPATAESPRAMDARPPSTPGSIVTRAREHIDAGAVDAAFALLSEEIARHGGGERAELLLGLAHTLTVRGEMIDSLRAAASACELYRAAADAGGECDAIIAMAAALRRAGEHAAAFSQLEQAEGIGRRLGDDQRLALVLRNLGVCCSLLGRHQQALSYLEDALRRHRNDRDNFECAQTRLSLLNARNRHAMSLADRSAQVTQSEDVLPDWLQLAADCEKNGYTRLQLMALGNHAITLRECGRHAEAITALQALLPRYRHFGMRPNEGICQQHLGAAHLGAGNTQLAHECFEAAIAIQENAGSLDDLRDSLDGLSQALEALGDFRGSLAALRRVRDVEARMSAGQAHVSAAQRDLRVELARLTNQWARLANQDPLTGLTNRRGLDAWWPEAMARARGGEPIAVLLLDLDRFKSINDRFGHSVGDAVLTAVARLIEANCRGGDLAVRYGGEEFLLAMGNADLPAAADVAQRLRQSVARHAWANVASGLTLTVSIGVAAAKEARDWEGLLALADSRLYSAKLTGRDRVVADGHPR